MKTDYQFNHIVKRGGPERPEEIRQVSDGLAYLIQEYGVVQGRQRFLKLMQSIEGDIHHHIFHWPRGYQGDFELIERIYLRQHTPGREGWDMLITEASESKAVRERPVYLCQHVKSQQFEGFTVVDVGCGPGRTTRDLMVQGNLDYGTLLLLDQDPLALVLAEQNTQGLGRAVTVQSRQANIIERRKLSDDPQSVRLIWCAGVFDYLNDRLAIRILRKWMKELSKGEIIIGNMSDRCPNRTYLDSMGWDLRYRTAEQLLEIGKEATKGIETAQLYLGSDDTGMNYFLHLKKV